MNLEKALELHSQYQAGGEQPEVNHGEQPEVEGNQEQSLSPTERESASFSQQFERYQTLVLCQDEMTGIRTGIRIGKSPYSSYGLMNELNFEVIEGLELNLQAHMVSPGGS